MTAGAPAITLTPPEQSDTFKLHTQLKFQFQVTTLSATLYSGESTLVRRERDRLEKKETPEEREKDGQREGTEIERVIKSMKGNQIHRKTVILCYFIFTDICYLYNMFRHWMDRMLVLRALLLVNS